MRILLISFAVLGGAAQAAPRPDPCRVREQAFISPAGEAFRAPPGAPAPVATWFAGADRNRDGRMTLAEMQADAARFFATVDRDGNGEIIPDELALYERSVPELSLYQSGPPDRRRRGKQIPYGAPIGGGRYALTNVPNPIAAADLDMNRGITRAESAAAIDRIFMTIAKTRGDLALADLPATPQAAMLAECAARAAKARR
ncbi:EF-hand domain-containing protein [Sphingomonas prati]|uniref:EF-hand domain-containing protein n=1 Tax=Sphingomonas prati TaxID=1843237 RepID=A0A7W9F3K8_9SPHN|nr:hypothetical protein [Sphingomonas prati]MBB5729620.1 hypothetical protein [Sphingomonas prati]GGE76055.1 hypothetical protein GCM10011404_05850 [Sphingomonas prati]